MAISAQIRGLHCPQCAFVCVRSLHNLSNSTSETRSVTFFKFIEASALRNMKLHVTLFILHVEYSILCVHMFDVQGQIIKTAHDLLTKTHNPIHIILLYTPTI